ncbi:hypothetical protein AVEN_92689-1 [Araneus ventricosus]|uniref:Uncharacterized protein n=1 Tax=Araneus ventricosus TaxID=182803 RepID=A0A4Y2VGJ6_ARAVE|nr:hypothetical protein AVEN_92689-1 [Araneus ventricosus]
MCRCISFSFIGVWRLLSIPWCLSSISIVLGLGNYFFDIEVPPQFFFSRAWRLSFPDRDAAPTSFIDMWLGKCPYDIDVPLQRDISSTNMRSRPSRKYVLDTPSAKISCIGLVASPALVTDYNVALSKC